jgi:hypothetical protein
MFQSRRPFRAISSIAVLLAALAAGCTHGGSTVTLSNGAGSATGPWSGYEKVANYATQRGTVIYQVTYWPQTVVFDQRATQAALKNISADGVNYTLDASEPTTQKLQPGSVLFLYGIAIRKVTAVRSQGSSLVVSTSDADITDAIRDGHIEWKVPVDFSVITTAQRPQQSDATLLDLFATRAAASVPETPPIEFEGSVGPLEYDLGFTPAGQRLGIEMRTTMTKPDAIIELKGDGYVDHLRALGRLLIANGKVDDLDYSVDDISGKVDFEWSAQKSEAGLLKIENQPFKLRIPGASIEIPLIIGGIPFVFEISAAIIIHPGFTSKGSFTTGHFTVTYNGKEGFSSGGSEPTPEGQVHGTDNIEHETSIGSIGPMGFVGALEMPRFELALAVMSPWNMQEVAGVGAHNSAARVLGNAGGFAYKLKNLGEVIEELAIPVKPYAFADIVTSASTLTAGYTGTMPGMAFMGPCQRAQLVVAANVGVGVKVNFAHHKILGMAPSADVGEFAYSKPIMHKSITRWKNGIKCPGDSGVPSDS